MIEFRKIYDRLMAEVKTANDGKTAITILPTEYAEQVLEMVKRQEPKPIAYTDNPYTGLPVARCPKCGKFARQFHAVTDEETHFCPWCGQAVKWNENDDT